MFIRVLNILILKDTQAFEIAKTEPDPGWVSHITYKVETEDESKLYGNFMQASYLVFCWLISVMSRWYICSTTF